MSVVHESPRPITVSGTLEIGAVFGTPRAHAAFPSPDTRDLDRLEHAVTVALSPLEYADATAWGDALTAALCSLADATAGTYLLPGAAIRWRAVTTSPTDAVGGDASWSIHDETTERLHEGARGDLVLWVRDDLAIPQPLRPVTRASGTVGLRVRAPDGTVAAVCVHRDRAAGPAPQQLLAALRAIAPAFRAGVAAWVSSPAARSNVARMLDSLAESALLFDLAGTLVHANPASDRLTTSIDAARLRDEAQRVAWALGAIARRLHQARQSTTRAADAAADTQSVRRVQIGPVVYDLRGSIVGEQLLGAEPAVLITITTTAAEPMTDDTLRSEFGLTAREIEVARLMAEGLSNCEIAERLGVRFFTARNHVERTLSKLGVASRHRVGPMLRNELVDNAAAA